jgi:uncharacterized protein YndB with AHSA1/START domain
MKILDASGEIAKSGELVLRRTFDATCERLFRAWLDPGDLALWYVPAPDWQVRISEVDMRMLGGFTAEFGDGREAPYVERVQFLAIEPCERLELLVQMTQEGAFLSVTRTTVAFRAKGDGAEMVVTERGAAPEWRQDRLGGWGGTLDNLARLPN